MSVQQEFTYTSNATAGEIAQRLRGGSDVLLLTHTKPDGDAIGSCLALHRGLRQIGIGSRILLAGPLDPNLKSIANSDDRIEHFEEVGLPDAEPDLIVILDTGALSQLEPFVEWLAPRQAKVIGIDHHARGDNVASMRLVEVTCAAATEALVPILEGLGVEIARDTIAEALFLGLATDTGWFQFSNAGPKVFTLAARLLEAGADKDALYSRIEQQSSLARMKMQARALATLRLVKDSTIAMMQLGPEDFAETGARIEELAGIVNEPMEIGSVRASILFVEFDSGTTKLSFRSKPGTEGQPGEDVNELAARFGGGGHVHAAGARIKESLDAAVAQVEAELG